MEPDEELENDPLHEHLLRFTDAAVEKIAELESHNRVLHAKVDTLTAKLDEIEKHHSGNTRDDLKVRMDDFEKKIHPLLEEFRVKNRQV